MGINTLGGPIRKSHRYQQLLSSFPLMTLNLTFTFKRDLDNVKMNQKAKYLGQRSFSSKVTVQTHTPDRLLYLNH